MFNLTRNSHLTINLTNYCKTGNIESLKQLLDSKSAESKKKIVAKVFPDGGTCLITACRFGHLPIVEYLIDHCHADVEQVGSVMFDGEQVEGVPPLWCAAAAGHLEVVRFLFSRNAHVNRTTITNSTALRAACFDGHIEVVRFLVQNGADIEIPNRHGHTCLMISCYRGHCKIVEYLLDKCARVNRTSAKGNTALNDCAESGNLCSFKLLLEHGAVMRKDEYGLTPIMAGANSGYKDIVDNIANSCADIPAEEKAQAYELLGANLYDRHSSLNGAIEAWNKAMNLRLSAFGYYKKSKLPPGIDPPYNVDGSGDHATHSNSRLKATAKEAFGHIREFSSPDELTSLLNQVNNQDKLRLQTLLIRLRILGPDHPDTIYFIRYRGAIYADAGDIKRCLSLWMYALELQRLYLEPLCHVAQSAFLSFAELFIYILSDAYSSMPAMGLHPEMILDCLELCVENVERGIDFSYYKWSKQQPWSYTSADKEATNLMRHVSIALHYICMLLTYYTEPGSNQPYSRSSLSDSTDSSNSHQSVEQLRRQQQMGYQGLSVSLIARGISAESFDRLKAIVYRFVKLDPRVYKGHTLLHMACSSDTSKLGRYPICTFPSPQVVRLLLEVGADPDTADAEGSRPVNIVSSISNAMSEMNGHDKFVSRGKLLKVLVHEGGAHLDARDRRDRTVLTSRSGKRCMAAGTLSWVRYTTLKCLCARVIQQEKILFTFPQMKSYLPQDILAFIDIH